MKKTMAFLLLVILVVAFAVPSAAASYSVVSPKWVTVDGVINAEEWGSPLYEKVTLAQAQENTVDDTLTCRWYDTARDGEVTMDLYLTHDEANLYVGCAVQGVNAEVSTTDQPWQQMNFTFTLSDYHTGTDVRRVIDKGEEYEAYTGYRIYQTADGQPHAQTLTQGLTPLDLRAGRDYAALYDPATRTMTYEVAVPLASTSIAIDKNPDIAFSAVVALEHYHNTVSGDVDGSNRFLVGTGAADCGGAENWAHQGQCIRVRLIQSDQVAQVKQGQAEDVQDNGYAQDLDIPIAAEPEYKIITADAPISVPLIIILASVAVVLGCAVAVTLTLVHERNQQLMQSGKDEEQ